MAKATSKSDSEFSGRTATDHDCCHPRHDNLGIPGRYLTRRDPHAPVSEDNAVGWYCKAHCPERLQINCTHTWAEPGTVCTWCFKRLPEVSDAR